ncbi:DMT family transporter [Jannaschia seohaensis]|uniref:EamA-like transporter family protein n=1 Tax=Jannaschia seohaensis TaxID=475081 RepID=A0A2Y9AK45_9RHOB|nr:DMT family transporter [Jannaschia seohaensis]PWJ20362.1 EamA-like transporter family protein [Jannaschia seohaensis]SSA44416.1 EamA-like transporter family protein [Jannaschia seohaensis]
MTPTLRSAGLMTLSMGLFAIEDALIKSLGGVFPAAQIVWMLGLGGTLAFSAWFVATGAGLRSPVYLRPRVLVRTGFEMAGALFFVSALVLAPLAVVSAIVQATPLLVAIGGALFLGAPVGPRRWAAIAVGFAGVLIILRPGTDAVDASAWLAVGGIIGLAGRDLATRNMPPDATGARLTLHAFAALIVGGAVMQAIQGAPLVVPDAGGAAVLLLAIAFGTAAYLAIVGATRTGDIAITASFRYTRMLFALIIAVVIFGERPDLWTLVGAGIIVASGCYTLWREARAASLG